MRRGFVDTARGLVLTTGVAKAAAGSQADAWSVKQETDARKEAIERQAETGLQELAKSSGRAVTSARRGGPSNLAELADCKAQEELASERLGSR